ncbi:LysM peptidoglycan-binding domain-containing protein [Grimontia sp. SpTr1]|uniref:LysM peptidoglycan-binding domain-containing protein n=1 Tax=Grimontia sp. SpTr1 TaxID=2995319 RepID=UPI00248C27CF|nr:LysM peptidoglycan-binding domain-containing protein [Grimontia sp. SpTr1]
MTKSYTIQSGDTLSALAVRFNTTIETLLNLNSQQIKNIDLIYDGNTLTVPTLPDTSTEKREPTPQLAKDSVAALTCKTQKFVDSLFIPEHPGNKKQQVLLLTQEAVDCVKVEADICKAALSGASKEDIVKGLNRLGILDPFNAVAHEMFLKIDNPESATHYKRALLEHLQLTQSGDVILLPTDNPDIGLGDISQEIRKIEGSFEEKKQRIKGQETIYEPGGYWGVVALSYEQALEQYEDERVSQYRKLKRRAIKALEEAIENFEKKATRIARKTKVQEGEHTFAFTDKGYYSSDCDAEVYASLKKLIAQRVKLEISDYLSPQTIKENSPLPDIDTVHKFYKYWRDKAHEKIEIAHSKKWNVRGYLGIEGIKHRDFFQAVHELNQTNTVIKEQFLTEDQLFRGRQKVKDLIATIEERNPSIEAFVMELKKLDNAVSFKDAIGYYPMYVLHLFLIREIGKRLRSFSERLGKHEAYVRHVRQLLDFALRLQQRQLSLKAPAKAQKSSPSYAYINKDMTYFGGLQSARNAEPTLLWDEYSWEPENLEHQIFAAAGLNNLSIVECALSSDPQTVLYLKSNHPAFENNLASCIKPLSLNPPSGAIGGGAAGNTFASETSIGNLSYQGTHYSTLADIPNKIIFPWHGNVINNEAFGLPGYTKIHSGAQFARFVRSAELFTDQKNTLSKDHVQLSGEVKAGFDLANAAFGFENKIPLPLDIRYRTKNRTSTSKNLGKGELCFQAQVHGFLSASVQLASNVHFGNMANGEIGVRGSYDQTTDFNESRSHSATIARNNEPTTIAAGARMEASAFAGLEVGGKVSCQFDWIAPQTEKRLNLFKTGVGVRATLGVGYKAVFQCTFHQGKFIFVTDMSMTKGLGVGGKFATELNVLAADDFFAAVLQIMESSDFHRFEFFLEDENGEDAFGAFNTVITVAAAFGLTLSQVLLLPFNIISNLEKEASDKKNAYYVAAFLNSKENLDLNEKWIRNMPAETLAKLFDVLNNYNQFPWIGSGEKAARNNLAQLTAINRIFQWLGAGEKKKPSTQQIRKFENAMQRVGMKKPHVKVEKKWERYAENIVSIRHFFELAAKDKFSSETYYPDSYKVLINRQMDAFHERLPRLMELTPLFKKSMLKGPHREEDVYLAIPVSDHQAIKDAVAKGYRRV